MGRPVSVQETTPGEVYRAICDGPGCGIPSLFEGETSSVPYGWHRIALGGRWVQFHDGACVRRWLRILRVDQRDTGDGWISRGVDAFLNKDSVL